MIDFSGYKLNKSFTFPHIKKKKMPQEDSFFRKTDKIFTSSLFLVKK